MIKIFKEAKFIGNVVATPELKTLNGDNKVCNFSLAVNTKTKEKEYTEFYDFEAWNGLAETITKYVSKGNKLFVNCTPKVHTWDEDGTKRSKIVFVVSDVVFLTPKKE